MPAIDIIPSPSRAPAKNPTQEQQNKPAPTPEEIRLGGEQMVSSLYPDEKPIAIAPAQPAPATPAPAPTPAPSPAAPAAPAPEPEPEPETEPLTVDETIQRTAAATAEAVAVRIAAPQPAAAPSAPAFQLIPEDEADLRALRYLAKEDSKYADLPDKFLAFVKAAYAYQDDWQAKNPDDTFNWEDSEHAKWHQANDPGIDGELIVQAKSDMRAEEKWQQKMQPIIEKQEAEQAWKESVPKVNGRVNAMIVTMADAVNPEIGKLLRNGNVPDLSDEAVARVEDYDPVARAILEESSVRLVPLITELEMTGIPKLKHQFDRNNPVHATILRYIKSTEDSVLSAPAADQVFQGKQFKRIADVNRMRSAALDGPGTDADKQRKLDEIDDRYTHLSIDDIQQVIVDDFAERAKAEIARRDAVARKKYVKNGAPPQSAPENVRPEPQPAREPAPATAAPLARPPSLSSGSDLLTAGKPFGSAPKGSGEEAVNEMFK